MESRLPAYRSEPHVAPDSQTPTFVAMALHIDNWRWAGVPFYLRTGKRMGKVATQVVIRFRRPPFVLFRKTSVAKLAPNEIVINIQPDEGISLNFEAKVPGPVVRLGAVNMSFEYSEYFGTHSADRIRDADLRLHDGRSHAVPARRHGRGFLGGRPADSGRLEGRSRERFSQLCRGIVGT